MAKVIKADLLKIKKEYALPRKTQIEDAKAVVLEEKKVQEQEVMFIMDRFGYAKTIDMSAYERNKEAVHNENRYVFSCMNTDKICIFTDNGSLHQIKVLDIPFTRFRDKGTPIDNLGNYDSSGENILYLTPFEQLKGKKMLFMTKLGMAKLVDTSEFEVSKRTVAATKLQEDDLLVGIYVTDAVKEVFSRFSLDGEVKEEEMIVSSQHVIVQTADGYFLRFPLSDVPEKKKGAVGVRAIKLTGKDTVEDVYLLTQGDELTIEYRGKNVDFARLKMAHRDTKGTKIRV
jgi:DNA gyrase subunit A